MDKSYVIMIQETLMGPEHSGRIIGVMVSYRKEVMQCKARPNKIKQVSP